MSKETERVFRELQAFMEEHAFSSEEEAIAAFHQQSNERLFTGEPSEPDAYDYLEMAQNAGTAASAKKYAKKALELEPDMAEAKLVLILHRNKTLEGVQADIEALLQEERAHLARQDITEGDCSGQYYQILETRPYLRIYTAYVGVLIDLGKMRRAAEACETICALNESDNLGVRHTLAALYALLEERAPAEALLKKYPEDSSFMLLPMTALYYKLGDEAAAQGCLTALCARNKAVRQAVQILKRMDEDELKEILEHPFFRPDSVEEAVIAYAEAGFLYCTTNEFLSWVEAQISPKRQPKKGRGGASKARGK